MVAVAPNEIRPGLVVRLDPAILIATPGCSTNAEIAGDGDRAVTGPHLFLVLHVDEVDGAALAVPLFSDRAPGSVALDESMKSGPSQGWVGTISHYSRWQHWWIPVEHLVQASTGDGTRVGTRRTYAEKKPAELSAIADWRLSNRAPWRGL